MLQVSSLQLLQAYQQHHFMRQGVQPSTKKVIEPNFDESDRKSNCDEDEIANIEDASEYEESSDDSNESDIDLNGNNAESADDNSMPTGKSGSNQVHSRNMRWRKPVHYDVTFKGEPFPPPPLEEYTPLHYFKQFFDDALIDHRVEQTIM